MFVVRQMAKINILTNPLLVACKSHFCDGSIYPHWGSDSAVLLSCCSVDPLVCWWWSGCSSSGWWRAAQRSSCIKATCCCSAALCWFQPCSRVTVTRWLYSFWLEIKKQTYDYFSYFAKYIFYELMNPFGEKIGEIKRFESTSGHLHDCFTLPTAKNPLTFALLSYMRQKIDTQIQVIHLRPWSHQQHPAGSKCDINYSNWGQTEFTCAFWLTGCNKNIHSNTDGCLN